MVKVHAVHVGSNIRIGHYGQAELYERETPAGMELVDIPCEVPEEVAAELEREIAGTPEVKASKGKPGVPGRPGRTDIRIAREATPKANAKDKPAAPAAPKEG